MNIIDELKFIVIIFSCLITKPVQLCLFSAGEYTGLFYFVIKSNTL